MTIRRSLVALAVLTGMVSGVRPTPAHAQDPQHPTASPFPPATPESVGLSSTDLAVVVDSMKHWADEGRVVGAEILIVKDRKTVLHEVVGWRDREREIPWEPNTICRIRSMTKPFVGTSILMLAEEGKLSLSDPVATYLPSFDNERSRQITIEHLLTHSGGYDQPGYPAPLGTYGSLREAVDAVGKAGPPRKPGVEYHYSDAGSATLGAIVAEVSGIPVERFIESRILAPLGLRDTFTNLTPDDPRRSRVSSTYRRTGSGTFTRYWDYTTPQLMKFFRASGGMYSTVTDYARFLALWMDRGRLGSGQLLTPESVRKALTRSPLTTQRAGYGLHWSIFTPADSVVADDPEWLPAFGHGGSDGTTAWAMPDDDVIVLYFTQSRGGSTPNEIASVVWRALGRG